MRAIITKTSLFKYTEIFTNKKWKLSDKNNSDIFHISAQNINCGYSLEPPLRGGSNEYPQSMFLSRNKKTNVYPVNPSFTISKWGLRGSALYRYVFVMEALRCPLIESLVIVECMDEQRMAWSNRHGCSGRSGSYLIYLEANISI